MVREDIPLGQGRGRGGVEVGIRWAGCGRGMSEADEIASPLQTVGLTFSAAGCNPFSLDLSCGLFLGSWLDLVWKTFAVFQRFQSHSHSSTHHTQHSALFFHEFDDVSSIYQFSCFSSFSFQNVSSFSIIHRDCSNAWLKFGSCSPEGPSGSLAGNLLIRLISSPSSCKAPRSALALGEMEASDSCGISICSVFVAQVS